MSHEKKSWFYLKISHKTLLRNVQLVGISDYFGILEQIYMHMSENKGHKKIGQVYIFIIICRSFFAFDLRLDYE